MKKMVEINDEFQRVKVDWRKIWRQQKAKFDMDNTLAGITKLSELTDEEFETWLAEVYDKDFGASAPVDDDETDAGDYGFVIL